MNLEHIVIDNIRKIRKAKGISQELLAEYCGTSASYIGLMETYKNIPKLSTIERIADALNVKPQILFEEQGGSEHSDKKQNLDDQIKERIKKNLLQSVEQEIDRLLQQV